MRTLREVAESIVAETDHDPGMYGPEQHGIAYQLRAALHQPGHVWRYQDGYKHRMGCCVHGPILPEPRSRVEGLEAALRDLLEASDDIHCYPEGSVGFYELWASQDRAHAALAPVEPEDADAETP